MPENVIYSSEQFNKILEMLIGANQSIATKFVIQKLRELGYFVLDREMIKSRVSLLQILDEVHSKNPDIKENEIMKDILEIQGEVRASI